jgi:myo-inositol-1-phosphate synthase
MCNKKMENKINIKEIPPQKIGVMLIGMGGNNGSTFVAMVEALKHDLKFKKKGGGFKKVDLFGSLYSHGSLENGVLFRDLVRLRDVNDIVVSGWDICGDSIDVCIEKNAVLEPHMVDLLIPYVKQYKPLPALHRSGFIAKNQDIRVDNIFPSKLSNYDAYKMIRSQIQAFKISHNLCKVIVIWTASTERTVTSLGWDSWDSYTYDQLYMELQNDIKMEIPPSMIYCMAALSDECIFVNGSPQHIIVKPILELAKRKKTFVIGEDFKTGQTKLKSVLVDFLVSSGIKPLSIVSYNHLGNNDGKNLSEEPQFESKEISKRTVIDDIINVRRDLYPLSEKSPPDHIVVIKYVPAVGDSKRAMDEYYSELVFDGRSTISIHNTCEDTLLAIPLMFDIVMFSEFFSRVDDERYIMSENLPLMSFFFKAPAVKMPTNAFFTQLTGLRNFFRKCVGLDIPDYIRC